MPSCHHPTVEYGAGAKLALRVYAFTLAHCIG